MGRYKRMPWKQGYFMLKLKIGSKGDQQEMLEQDLTFLRKIHASIGHFENTVYA